ncbi:hypothetical protein COV53_05060 [Candidatus Gottesmanbacteria bacterium CG11_big_fil_rev_8_21_14_0_20_37_11]|uniref:HMA domain-containing protein n=1 Tax=Candidatus Gottesmanbacteria bacterium CG11_big_fil_rev_8_21_14_0_20_37_11 TaxID=1974575 RepID=A0A2H0NGL2_9BACT|nr:MAG: hypothetical protein COV53_05060 [Candidatus Gottesmanbacteria bacterium CG11_big_fil_rev_8_21_14_0_20_37_11]
MKKTTINIKGMHCRSCELLVEGELGNLKGVNEINVSQKKGVAEILHEEHLDYEQIRCLVEKAGYEIGVSDKKPFFTKDFNIYAQILTFAITIFLGYILLYVFDIKISTPAVANHPSSLFVVLLIGITAGFSTCMALVGGLVLGVSARFSEKHPDATPMEKFKPHLYFNAGRIVSYIIFGAIIGLAGSFFQLSGIGLGFLTIAVSLVMLLMGIQLTGIFPRLEDVKITLPVGLARILGLHKKNDGEYSNKNSAIMGGLTFFLPCGFTQAMQLYAMTTGNPVSGALIMGIFAIGTAPGLLGVGGLTSVVKGAFAQSFFRLAGLVVILLSLFNLSNGLNLTGLSSILSSRNSNVLAATDTLLENGNQIIRMTQDAGGYKPNSFIVKKDIPVRWIIDSKDPNTCAASIVSDKLNVRKNLHPGENVIEFTPTEEGIIRFTCSMGMFTGSISVVGNSGGAVKEQALAANDPANIPPQAAQGASCGGKGGCGCGGGGSNTFNANDPKVTPKPAVNEGDVQILKTTYTQSSDIQPNTFTVKSGKKVRMEIDVKDNGSGCMSTITVPRLVDDPKFLAKGKTIVFEFTPSSTGDYPITCAMGVPRGVIKVI